MYGPATGTGYVGTYGSGDYSTPIANGLAVHLCFTETSGALNNVLACLPRLLSRRHEAVGSCLTLPRFRSLSLADVCPLQVVPPLSSSARMTDSVSCESCQAGSGTGDACARQSGAVTHGAGNVRVGGAPPCDKLKYDVL